jgi:uncharacterized membrane protein
MSDVPAEQPRERTLELDRVVNFSDAVFAIAATVLVLSISIPPNLTDPGLDQKLWDAFQDALPQIFAYALSFYTIGLYWLAHHRLFRFIRRIDGTFIILNLLELGLVALLPFPTETFGDYTSNRPAVIVYALAVSAVGLSSTVKVWYAQAHDLMLTSTPRDWLTHGLLRGLSMPLVFLASIPIAFVSVTAAEISWSALVLLRLWFRRRYGKITDIW